MQLFNIRVLVYPERVEIKGAIPTQILDKTAKEEPKSNPALVISSPSPWEGRGKKKKEGLRGTRLDCP